MYEQIENFAKEPNRNKSSNLKLTSLKDWRIIIASNRGPITHVKNSQGQIIQQKGSGGLITGLSGIVQYIPTSWIACAQSEEDIDFSEGDIYLTGDHKQIHLKYLQPDPQTYERYYNVISNPLLWFLQHSMWNVPSEPIIDYETWKAWNYGYKSVNYLFAEEIIRVVKNTAGKVIVMLQDYHLYLTARYIRDLLPRKNQPIILHFIHIPWPGPEYWRILPPTMRQGIIDSLCAVDLLGFQTKEDGLNFLRTVESQLLRAHVKYQRGRIWYKNHATHIRDFPISIDVHQIKEISLSKEVDDHREVIKEICAGRKLIVRVDRIDPSKNIIRGFKAYEELLNLHPEYQEGVIFLALLVPSRRGIEEYKDYLDKIMAISGQINADFGSSNWEPIRILVGEDYQRAIAAMQLYDVLLVNAIADGMNLVAKEGPILNQKDGVLILSESAGASQQLEPGAIVISPCDTYATAEAIHQGLSMARKEKRSRSKTLKWLIENDDISDWLTNQLNTVVDLIL